MKARALLESLCEAADVFGPVYHGTEHDFDEFSPAFQGRMTGAPTRGFWFTDSAEAAEFYHSGEECGGRVIVAYLTMKNPLHVSYEEFFDGYPDGPPKWAVKARAAGHDGVILHDITDGDQESTVYCVFSPAQIRQVKE